MPGNEPGVELERDDRSTWSRRHTACSRGAQNRLRLQDYGRFSENSPGESARTFWAVGVGSIMETWAHDGPRGHHLCAMHCQFRGMDPSSADTRRRAGPNFCGFFQVTRADPPELADRPILFCGLGLGGLRITIDRTLFWTKRWIIVPDSQVVLGRGSPNGLVSVKWNTKLVLEMAVSKRCRPVVTSSPSGPLCHIRSARNRKAELSCPKTQ